MKKRQLFFLFLGIFAIIYVCFKPFFKHMPLNKNFTISFNNSTSESTQSISHLNQQKKLKQDTFYIGIVRTTEQKNSSIISFYNKNFQFVTSDVLPYAAICDCMTLPISKEGEVYFLSQGVLQESSEEEQSELCIQYTPISNEASKNLSKTTQKKKSMSIKERTKSNANNKTEGTWTSYHMEMPSLLQMAISDDFIFSINELNFTSYISKYDRGKKKVSRNSSDTFSYETIYYYDGFLYATGTKLDGQQEKNYIFQIDPATMKILWKKDITKYGKGGIFFLGIGKKVYFTLPYTKKEEGNNVLMMLDYCISKKKAKVKLTPIRLSEKFPQQIKEMNRYILVSHCDFIEEKGNTISVINKKSHKANTISFPHTVLQMETDPKNNLIYILSTKHLYAYELNKDGTDVTLKNQLYLKKMNQKEEENDCYYYTGGFFLLSQEE